MYIYTIAEVNSDNALVLDQKYEEFLKPGMKVQILIDNVEEKQEIKNSFSYIFKESKNQCMEIKVDITSKD